MTYILSGGHGGHGGGGHGGHGGGGRHGGHHGGHGGRRGGGGWWGGGYGWGYPTQYIYDEPTVVVVDDLLEDCVTDPKTGKVYCRPTTSPTVVRRAVTSLRGFGAGGHPGLGPARQHDGLGKTRTYPTPPSTLPTASSSQNKKLSRPTVGGLGATGFVGRSNVPTKLIDGDQLDTSDASHSLAKLYNTTAQAIVQANGVPFTTAAIERDGGWVQKTGGRRITLPDNKTTLRWVFSSNSVILLPAGGPRQPATGATIPKSEISEAGVNPIVAVVGLVALGALLLADRKAKRSKAA